LKYSLPAQHLRERLRAARRARTMHGENLRKFTETGARATNIDFTAAKNTVCGSLFACLFAEI
jgi:hypothetical protein